MPRVRFHGRPGGPSHETQEPARLRCDAQLDYALRRLSQQVSRTASVETTLFFSDGSTLGTPGAGTTPRSNPGRKVADWAGRLKSGNVSKTCRRYAIGPRRRTFSVDTVIAPAFSPSASRLGYAGCATGSFIACSFRFGRSTFRTFQPGPGGHRRAILRRCMKSLSRHLRGQVSFPKFFHSQCRTSDKKYCDAKNRHLDGGHQS